MSKPLLITTMYDLREILLLIRFMDTFIAENRKDRVLMTSVIFLQKQIIQPAESIIEYIT